MTEDTARRARLGQISERLAETTPGEWSFSNASDVRGNKGEFRAPSPYNGFLLVGPWCDDADIEFLVASKADVTWLLAEVDRLRAALDEQAERTREEVASEIEARLLASWRDESSSVAEFVRGALADAARIARSAGGD